MKRALFMIALAWPAWGQMGDRIAVTVGKTVITESEVLTNLRVAAFLDRKEAELSSAEKHKAAERLVDQVLLRREVSPGVPEEPLEALKQLREQYPSEDAYHQALDHYSITERDIADQLQNGLESVTAANRRFRPEAQVSEAEARAQYEKLTAQWRAQKVEKIPPFEAGRAEVEQLVINQKVSEALEVWLEITRQQSGIVYREKVFQ